MKPEIYFFIKKNVDDEKRQIKNAFKKLIDLYDNDELKSDSILLTPIKKTVTFSSFKEAISEKVSSVLYKQGYLKIENSCKLILMTERTFSISSNVETLLGVFVSNKMFSEIDEYSKLKYILIIPSEVSEYDYWIKKWQPIIIE